MEWPPGPDDRSDPFGLTVRDVCDVVYGLMLDRAEKQALALQQQYAVYRAAGAELEDEWPSLDAAQEQLDAALNAEPVASTRSPRDVELLTLLGVA